MKVQILIAASLVLADFITVNRARADAVVDWNVITGQAIPFLAGPVGTLHSTLPLSISPFTTPSRLMTGGSNRTRRNSRGVRVTGSGCRRAHDVLVSRFPTQAGSLDTIYHDYLASHGLAEDDPGVAVGQQAAAAIIALRANDGSCRLIRKFSTAAPLRANGVRLLPLSRRWRSPGWPM